MVFCYRFDVLIINLLLMSLNIFSSVYYFFFFLSVYYFYYFFYELPTSFAHFSIRILIFILVCKINYLLKILACHLSNDTCGYFSLPFVSGDYDLENT